MANTKISQLTALGATPADDDVLAIVDTSDSSTKKVTVANLVAAGFDANASRVTIGLNAASQGSGGTDFYNIAIGDSASAIGTAGVAIGRQASVANGVDNAVAIGIGSSVGSSGDGSVALGRNAEVNGTDQIAIGNDSGSSGTNSETIAIGSNAGTTSQGAGSIAIGKTADSAGNYGVAIGQNAAATQENAVAIGTGATASQVDSIAIGGDNNTFARSLGSICIGEDADNTDGSNAYSVVIGKDASVTGTNNFDTVTIGRASRAGGSYAIGLGYLSRADAENALVINASGTNREVTTQYGIDIRTSAAGSLTYDTTNKWTFGAGVNIDGNGHLLVGKTSQDATNTVGFEAKDDGVAVATTDGAQSLILNRKTSDGTIAEFRKDNATKGLIGTGNTGRFHIGSGDIGLMFAPSEDAVYPWDSTSNAQRDGAIDLGYSSHRFKDLYLSGGAYLGGTAAANKLDDYEEGAWTPAFGTITSGPTVGAGATYFGNYTKVGRIVHVRFAVAADNSATSVSVDDRFELTGLPFSVASSTGTAAGSIWIYNSISTGNNAFGVIGVSSTSDIANLYITHIDGTINYGAGIRGEFTYTTDA